MGNTQAQCVNPVFQGLSVACVAAIQGFTVPSATAPNVNE